MRRRLALEERSAQPSRRQLRMAAAVHTALSDAFYRDGLCPATRRGDGSPLVDITEVNLSMDLRHAVVRWTPATRMDVGVVMEGPRGAAAWGGGGGGGWVWVGGRAAMRLRQRLVRASLVAYCNLGGVVCVYGLTPPRQTNKSINPIHTKRTHQNPLLTHTYIQNRMNWGAGSGGGKHRSATCRRAWTGARGACASSVRGGSRSVRDFFVFPLNFAVGLSVCVACGGGGGVVVCTRHI